MDERTVNRIKSLLSSEYTMRLLVQYFISKGFRNGFDTHVYPPILRDMQDLIPQLADKIEIEPSVNRINQREGVVELDWNMFVLGDRRMYLGRTTHRSLSELNGGIAVPGGSIVKLVATPKKIISFIVRTLSDQDEVVRPSVSPIPRVPTVRPRIGPTYSGSYYEKKRPVL